MTSSDSSNSSGNSRHSSNGNSNTSTPTTSPNKVKRNVRNNNSSISNASKRLSKHKVIIPLEHGCEENWSWSRKDLSKDIVLCGKNDRTVCFHPRWSTGTAGVKGKRPLNNGRFYWELHVTQRIYGTSIMFGIGTKFARLHVNSFTNILGANGNSWGFSHKGVLWHNGLPLLYADRFRENQPTVVGVLFDGIDGTLTYYKDGKCLGVAFRDLDKITQPLYPMVSSTAAKTEMTLKNTRSDLGKLQARCRAVIMKHVKSQKDLMKLKLPTIIQNYLSEALNQTAPLRQVDNYHMLFEL